LHRRTFYHHVGWQSSTAALLACLPDYEMLRPVLVELKRRYTRPSARTRWEYSAPISWHGVARRGNREYLNATTKNESPAFRFAVVGPHTA